VTGSTQPALPAAVPAAPVRVPSAAAPKWLGAENAEWRGNYKVRFWDADWQALLMGKRDAALDRIAASGFDGVYLDRADVFADLKAERPAAKEDMVGLVEKIADYARRLNPGFLVVLQNAEELMAHESVRRAIDAIAKEDLLYGINGEGLANDSADVTASLHYLKLAQKSGRPVLVVEYLSDRKVADDARRKLAAHGFISYFAPRDLGRLNVEF
jgi:cysteinyl-tRNA synthetase